MQSHRYQVTPQDFAKLILWPLFYLVIACAAIHAAARFHLLPTPLPLLDVDRTILLHQAAASLEPSGATTVLLGDSSCLMNISAPELQAHLGTDKKVLNLGTISYLDLNAHGLLLSNYIRANPGTLRRVVLLMHPEALRLRQHDDYFRNIMTRYFVGQDTPTPRTATLIRISGAEKVQNHLLGRFLPTPLPGPWGRFYGFSHDLWNHLSLHQGSAIDPRSYSAADASGNPEYRMAPEVENASRAFRSSLPAGVELWIGISPSPSNFVLPSHERTCAQMLIQWGIWIGANHLLTNLPCSLPGDMFASTTHLNAKGRLHFTRLLAQEMTKATTGIPNQTVP